MKTNKKEIGESFSIVSPKGDRIIHVNGSRKIIFKAATPHSVYTKHLNKKESIFKGIRSIANLSGTMRTPKFMCKSDFDTMRSDWNRIGKDVYESISKFEKEHSFKTCK